MTGKEIIAARDAQAVAHGLVGLEWDRRLQEQSVHGVRQKMAGYETARMIVCIEEDVRCSAAQHEQVVFACTYTV